MSAPGTVPARVLIADGYRARGAGVAAALSAAQDLRIVATAGSAAEAVSSARRLRPGAALVDVDLPATEGAGAASHCAALSALGVRVVLIGEAFDAEVLLDCVGAGAWGYLTAEVGLATVMKAVRLVVAGETVFSRAMVTALVRGLSERRRDRGPEFERYLQLTRREKEVLQLLAAGHDDTAMAGRLGISPSTTRWHAANVRSKLGVRSRNEAAALAARLGVLDAAGRATPDARSWLRALPPSG